MKVKNALYHQINNQTILYMYYDKMGITDLFSFLKLKLNKRYNK